MIRVKVSGLDRVISRAEFLVKNIPTALKEASNEVVSLLDERAMTNLNNSLRWGHSTKGDSIKDSKFIEGPEISGYVSKVTLGYSSPHASVVEFGGGIGTSRSVLVTRRPPNPPFPIGATQGFEPEFRYSFRVQQGYHYLGSAVQSQKKRLVSIYRKHLLDLVR